MNRKSFVLPVIVIVFVAILVLTKCGGSGGRNDDVKQDSPPAKLNTPAPDNNSANNPSTADTAFQKDSTHRRDTVH